MTISEVLALIRQLQASNPHATKQEIATSVARTAKLLKRRSVYTCDQFSIRFSTASGDSFSNVVLSLSALRAFDHLPFIVAIIRPDSCEFLLANTTFLKKISHSSHRLRIDNVRGSFLGHDILRKYEGIANRPENFASLFAMHEEFTWEENLERLVEATNQVVGTGKRFSPTMSEQEAILRSPILAKSLIEHPDYVRLKHEINEIVTEQSPSILELASIDNVNLRGNQVEQVITGGINAHGLGDMVRHLANKVAIQLEIKTKLMDRASSPKAYNIDKALAALAQGDTAIAFCFVGITVGTGTVTSSTVSIFDRVVLTATRVQFHWAGRNSRGVTQLSGDFSKVFSPNYQEQIDVNEAKRFLEEMLRL